MANERANDSNLVLTHAFPTRADGIHCASENRIVYACKGMSSGKYTDRRGVLTVMSDVHGKVTAGCECLNQNGNCLLDRSVKIVPCDQLKPYERPPVNVEELTGAELRKAMELARISLVELREPQDNPDVYTRFELVSGQPVVMKNGDMFGVLEIYRGGTLEGYELPGFFFMSVAETGERKPVFCPGVTEEDARTELLRRLEAEGFRIVK
jgi:hypothetical protein